jgi:predicted acetyltransferase
MPHTAHPAPQLVEAKGEDLACIEGLMQFYNYELSQWYPVEFGARGLYAIRSKAEYWARPDVRPYLLKTAQGLAGFAVVDGEVVDPDCQHNLGYFFVGRRYRGQGLAAQAVSALLQRFPGAWEIYHLALNTQARGFWPVALQRAGVRDALASEEDVHGEASVMYRFKVPPETAP